VIAHHPVRLRSLDGIKVPVLGHGREPMLACERGDPEIVPSLLLCLTGLIGRGSGFTTALVLRLDPDGTLAAANAGHIAPYANRKSSALTTACRSASPPLPHTATPRCSSKPTQRSPCSPAASSKRRTPKASSSDSTAPRRFRPNLRRRLPKPRGPLANKTTSRSSHWQRLWAYNRRPVEVSSSQFRSGGRPQRSGGIWSQRWRSRARDLPP
jgi:hypothetical protein